MLPATRQLGRETLAGLVGKISEDVLAARPGQTGSGALDREPYRKTRFDIPESIDAGCLGIGAPHHQHGHQGAGKNAIRAHGLLLSGGPSWQWPNEPLPD
jgi:hypothetical protein